MISNERLAQLVAFEPKPSNEINSATQEEWRAMARELQALRKAFSEPAAWVPMSQLSLLWKKNGVVVEADLSAIQRFNEVPLYCKPTLTE